VNPFAGKFNGDAQSGTAAAGLNYQEPLLFQGRKNLVVEATL
jgi:hypothetical protein